MRKWVSNNLAVILTAAVLVPAGYFGWKSAKAPIVQAQAQTSFSQNFTFTGTAAGTYQYIKIPNRAQTGHTVEVQWPSHVSAGCPIQLDGSGDGANWFAVASAATAGGYVSSAGFEFLTANGYFTFLRIKVFGTSTCSGVAHTGIYTGYQTPLPLSNIASITDYVGVAGVSSLATLAPSGPANGIRAFQCLNTNAAIVFLQIFNAASPPSLGGVVIFQAAVPSSGSFMYIGPELVGQNVFYVGASTTSSGTVAVSSPIACTFEQDFSGPWLPTLLASP